MKTERNMMDITLEYIENLGKGMKYSPTSLDIVKEVFILYKDKSIRGYNNATYQRAGDLYIVEETLDFLFKYIETFYYGQNSYKDLIRIYNQLMRTLRSYQNILEDFLVDVIYAIDYEEINASTMKENIIDYDMKIVNELDENDFLYITNFKEYLESYKTGEEYILKTTKEKI